MMTDPNAGVKRETVVFHDKDGYETKNVADAVTVEITREKDDGTESKTILRRKS